jgi:acyl-CoA thioester hydrolase
MGNCVLQSEQAVQRQCRNGRRLEADRDRRCQSLTIRITPAGTRMNAADITHGLSGRLEMDGGERCHRLPVRVYYEDTDFSGVAYHASYVRWCERGRSDFLRLLGSDHRRLLEGADGGDPAALMVKRLTLDYRRPAVIDEVLVVETRVAALNAATLELTQTVSRIEPDGAQPTLLVLANVTIVLVARSGKVLRLGRVLGPVFEPARSAS